MSPQPRRQFRGSLGPHPQADHQDCDAVVSHVSGCPGQGRAEQTLAGLVAPRGGSPMAELTVVAQVDPFGLLVSLVTAAVACWLRCYATLDEEPWKLAANPRPHSKAATTRGICRCRVAHPPPCRASIRSLPDSRLCGRKSTFVVWCILIRSSTHTLPTRDPTGVERVLE